ncbi:hypothetical protein [Lentilactobacillus curieae]|nr:hypothetical protein [Lentilactobacillus curieae]
MDLGKYHRTFTKTRLAKILDSYGYTSLPFSVKDFFNYIENNGI